jgi:hypothetical protein
VKQIKTSVCGYNLFSSGPQFFAAIGKLLKLQDFWIHKLVSKFGIVRQFAVGLTNLREVRSK